MGKQRRTWRGRPSFIDLVDRRTDPAQNFSHRLALRLGKKQGLMPDNMQRIKHRSEPRVYPRMDAALHALSGSGQCGFQVFGLIEMQRAAKEQLSQNAQGDLAHQRLDRDFDRRNRKRRAFRGRGYVGERRFGHGHDERSIIARQRRRSQRRVDGLVRALPFFSIGNDHDAMAERGSQKSHQRLVTVGRALRQQLFEGVNGVDIEFASAPAFMNGEFFMTIGGFLS